MAKRGQQSAGKTEAAIEGFAEDLGRILGTARGRADKWLQQRQTIAKNLEQIRDTATTLLTELGHQAQALTGRGKKKVHAPAPVSRRKRRKLSAKARRAISEAQKARWAKLRKKENP